MLTIKSEWISTSVQHSTWLFANAVSTSVSIVWLIKHCYLYSPNPTKNLTKITPQFLSYFWSSLRLITLRVTTTCLFIFLRCQGSAFRYYLRKSLQYAVYCKSNSSGEQWCGRLETTKTHLLFLPSAVFLTLCTNKQVEVFRNTTIRWHLSFSAVGVPIDSNTYTLIHSP